MSKQIDPVYRSFLVRCWFISAETAVSPPAWRFEVQEVAADPQKHQFSNFDQLQAFLAAKLTAVATESNPDNGKDILN